MGPTGDEAAETEEEPAFCKLKMKPVILISTALHPLDGREESLIMESPKAACKPVQKTYTVLNTDTFAGILIKFNIKSQDFKKWNSIHSEQDIHCGTGLLFVSPPVDKIQDDFEYKHRKSVDSTGSRRSYDSGCFIESKSEQKLDLITNLANTHHNYDKVEHWNAKDSLELVNFEEKEDGWRWSQA